MHSPSGYLVKYIIVNTINHVNYLQPFSHAGRQEMKGDIEYVTDYLPGMLRDGL